MPVTVYPGTLLELPNQIVTSLNQRISTRLRNLADPEIAAHSQRFFKTGKGQYGEGDRFLGIRVPVIRAELKRYPDITLDDIGPLLHSPYHEARLFALLAMVRLFNASLQGDRRPIYRFYLGNTRYINNWDLVDSSAAQIVGAYLETRQRRPLYKLVKSASLWERRIAVLATFHFIRSRDYADALRLAEQLLDDDEDLIHKAVGWMLREIGKRDTDVEKTFLQRHCRQMPRTMLRYAIERFPERERRRYLHGKI